MVLPTLLSGTLAATAAWLSCRYAWWRLPVDWRQPRVLMYHMVSPHRPGTRFNKLRVTPEAFEKQIAWLKARQFHFIFASQLFSGEPLPERAVCLTFDDGYEDNLLAADPVLARLGAVATLYLVGDRSGGWSSRKKPHHDDDELMAEPKLSDDQVRTMLASERWELGGHTKTHANLIDISDDEALDEIALARSEFPSLFDRLPATFAYPFGLLQQRHAAMVRQAGYLGAFTVEPGISPMPYADPMNVKRVKVSGKDGLMSFALRMRTGMRGWSS